MKCIKCGADNIEGSTFCIKCGVNLKELQSNNVLEKQDEESNPIVLENNNQVEEQVVNSKPVSNNTNTIPLNYLMYFVAVFLKPSKCFKEEESKLTNNKTPFILTLIVTVVMTIVNLINSILATVMESDYSGGYDWDWSNLEEFEWFKVIGKNFLIYACTIFAIAAVFYMGSLIIKKDLKFTKSLSIVISSIIPTVVGGMILGTIGTFIWYPIGIIFTLAGFIYSLVILYELMNKELGLEGDIKIYFNLICLGILAVAGYFVYMKLYISSITNGLDSMLDF